MDKDLISRLAELKKPPVEVDSLKSELISYISAMPKVDTDQITRDIHAALLSMMNTQNTISEERKSSILDNLRAATDEFNKNIGRIDQEQKKTLSALTDVLKGLSKEVNSIEFPKTDLSGVEKSIKNIKPTSTKGLEKKIDTLGQMLSVLARKEPEKIDIKPIVDAINKPNLKTVEFTVETDQWDFPTKVIAREK